jgi:L-lactate dehydrogenase complex protein LldE
VTYHASCHQLRELNVRRPPRALLEAAGVTVAEMADPERCCGFGGTFAVTHSEVSVPMADAKLDQAVATNAKVLVACDSSCLLHLSTRAAARGLDIECRHLAEVVAAGLEEPR